MGAPDGARGDGAAATTKATGGCGCMVGGGHSAQSGFWTLLGLGIMILWRGYRPRRGRVDRD